ncbi:MAG: major capsid protein [Chloroflexi bacterium]|nr:major capsid protein [Chloroflexota bacterium]
MDLITLLNEIRQNNGFEQIARNPAAQFGRPRRQYLGATLLPERTDIPGNAYREENIRYRTVVANSGTRYSPTQKKEGDLVGSFWVELAESDIAREFTGQKYDTLLSILQGNRSMQAIASITNWLDTTVNLALVELLEAQRWQAIVNAQIVRTGDNKLSETVVYSNPAGHRAAASAAWSEITTDPFADIHARVDLLASKGYTVNRIITRRNVLSIMAQNPKVKTRVGVAVVNEDGQITSAVGRASHDAINGALQADGLPAIELYDQQYTTQSGTEFFLPAGTMVFACTTGQSEEIDLGDQANTIYDTLGYTAIGRGVGQSANGRVIRAEAYTNKPPRIEAEGWQTALPVITEPEALAVIHTIS